MKMKRRSIARSLAFLAAFALLPALPAAMRTDFAACPPLSVQELCKLPEESPPPAASEPETPPAAPAEPAETPLPALPDTYPILVGDEVQQLSPLAYICGVTAAEMPITFHPEALKAQAVAAHSYALRQMGLQLSHPDPALKGAVISTDPAHFQAYYSEEERKALWGNNFDEYEKKLTEAVSAVIGDILVYEEQPAAAAFHAISSGKTESAKDIWGREIPYLISADSPEDVQNPRMCSEVTLTSQEVSLALSASIDDLSLPPDPKNWFSDAVRTAGGSIKTMQVGAHTLTGEQLRSILGLASANFEPSFDGKNFHFQVKGRGHGVGMSQCGADAMAQAGADWQEILTRYYPGTSLRKAGA